MFLFDYIYVRMYVPYIYCTHNIAHTQSLTQNVFPQFQPFSMLVCCSCCLYRCIPTVWQTLSGLVSQTAQLNNNTFANVNLSGATAVKLGNAKKKEESSSVEISSTCRRSWQNKQAAACIRTYVLYLCIQIRRGKLKFNVHNYTYTHSKKILF